MVLRGWCCLVVASLVSACAPSYQFTTSQAFARVTFLSVPTVDLVVEGVHKDYCAPTDTLARLPMLTDKAPKDAAAIINPPQQTEIQLLTASPKRFLFTGTAQLNGQSIFCRVPLQVQLETGKAYEFRFVSGLTVCAVEWREIIENDQGFNTLLLRKFLSREDDSRLAC